MSFLTRFAAITENQVQNLPKPDLGGPTVQHALQLFFGVAGAVAFLVIILSGLKYVLSRGDANAIKNAKEAIIYAVVGLVITMTGYGIVTFVIGRL